MDLHVHVHVDVKHESHPVCRTHFHQYRLTCYVNMSLWNVMVYIVFISCNMCVWNASLSYSHVCVSYPCLCETCSMLYHYHHFICMAPPVVALYLYGSTNIDTSSFGNSTGLSTHIWLRKPRYIIFTYMYIVCTGLLNNHEWNFTHSCDPQPVVSAEEREWGLLFVPPSQEVTVHHSPISSLTFSQFTASLTGTLSCLG